MNEAALVIISGNLETKDGLPSTGVLATGLGDLLTATLDFFGGFLGTFGRIGVSLGDIRNHLATIPGQEPIMRIHALE